jgi:hypothetical protein
MRIILCVDNIHLCITPDKISNAQIPYKECVKLAAKKSPVTFGKSITNCLCSAAVLIMDSLHINHVFTIDSEREI